MNILGKVEVIINEHLTIISSSETLKANEVINVFSLIDEITLKDMGYKTPLYYPKGELYIVCMQEDNKYLAKTFRKKEISTRKIVSSLSAGSSLTFLKLLQPETQEITEKIEGPWSAELNKNESLNIDISNIVSVGDLIGRLI